MVKRRKKRVSRKVTVVAPKGWKVNVKHKKSRRNPIVLEVGGKKRKFHVAIGRKQSWEDA